MPDQSTAADVAALKAEMDNVKASVDEIKAAAIERARKQSEDTRLVLSRIDDLRTALNLQQGFLNGALFTVKAFWAITGGIAVVVVGKLTGIMK
jgi:hypothetical protein